MEVLEEVLSPPSWSVSVSLSLQPYPLRLRSTFGTSHSSTTGRTNALFTLKIGSLEGYGEVGLPPKKPFIYEADYEDLIIYWEEFCLLAKRYLSEPSESALQYDPFSTLPSHYFPTLRKSPQKDSIEISTVRVLFNALDDLHSMHEWAFKRAGKSGIESALLILWATALNLPVRVTGMTDDKLYELIGVPSPYGISFATTALAPLEEMLTAAKRMAQSTPYSKIKLNHDVQRGISLIIVHSKGKEILEALVEVNRGNLKDIHKKWSIDANGAWTPSISLEFLSFLSSPPFSDLLYMVEEPFPLDLIKGKVSEEEKEEWVAIKQKFEEKNIFIIADESVTTSENLPLLQKYVSGVNVKLEKTGGIREALQVIAYAKTNNLKVWVGMMVASGFNANVSAQLLPLAEYGGDLDGALLVEEDSQLFKGGFVWENIDGKPTGRILLSSLPGIGMMKK